ncbi:ATP-binding protein [Streptomyces sp. NPDC003077]|uniref:ATP-binding protein n=1 Tax=Streptomyces sp. NPDC003077 TaxID=3154443 RepID=UPI0033A54957
METGTTWEYTVHVPHDPRAIPIARHTLRDILDSYDCSGLVERAELLATELLTNAVRHTDGPASLRVHWRWKTLRLGVWDTDPRPPLRKARAEPSESEAGRGLLLLESQASDWGWFTLSDRMNEPNGKFVWCELTP